ncbi:D-cysteine desulfhydrase family protein [Kiloniella sp. EL199]|uniref:D-cysteine desulfhydrase family protein n=1 Tax=Kiloniella sp. EL199 TaxID=2107581 RepID=UPI000EA292C5|nr:D-cysteine desulfhydrase family protein [Kiloniella sp. EL199]
MDTKPEDLVPELKQHRRIVLGHEPTPIEKLTRLGQNLGIELWIKRDDCNGLAFGGNKVRQLEYYLGPGVDANADTVLITGALQSNFVRLTAAAAAKLGWQAHVQLEERVPSDDQLYRKSGNIFLNNLLGAEISYFPEGEDEAGADKALDKRAKELEGEGRRPYVIHLGLGSLPYGGLGYIRAAAETYAQVMASGKKPDYVVIPSGSGLTHAGFLVGARAIGWDVPIIGICVRRDQKSQTDRIRKRSSELAQMISRPNLIIDQDIIISDKTLAPGYGKMNSQVKEAIEKTAQQEAILLDPVYTARTMAGLIDQVRTGEIPRGAKVLFIHTGGNPALFAYQNAIEGFS